MDKNAIKALYIHALRGTSPDVTKYSATDIKGTIADEFNKLCATRKDYEDNKYTIFQIMQESFDEVLPKYVGDAFGVFAEYKTVGLNQKYTFKVKRGRMRAKTFITEVGLSGVYEAFRLDHDYFEVGGKAFGGAAYIDFERLRSGDEDITEPFNLLMEGLQEAINREIAKALIATVQNSDMPIANKVSAPSFDPAAMMRLITIAKTYGGGSAVILATPEWVAEMGPDAIGMPILANQASNAGYATPVYSPKDINDIANGGFVTTFRGTPIVQLPQSFVDENNDMYQIPSQYAFVMPANQGEKIVKVVFEGETQIDDFKNRDRSIELEVYKRFGVAILTTNNWCVYENLSLASKPCIIDVNNLGFVNHPHKLGKVNVGKDTDYADVTKINTL